MRHTLAAPMCAMLITLSACADQTTQPVETAPPDIVAPELSDNGGTQSLNQPSSVRWNRTAIALFRSRGGNAGRVNAYVALAEYRAVLAALDGRKWRHWHHSRRPSLAGAVSGAAVVVLKQFYPLDAAVIDAELAAQRAGYASSFGQSAFDSGEALGREVGAAVLVQAASDNSGVAALPVQPVGPGFWVSSGAPIVKGGFGSRPFFLRSQDEINAPAPPVFGSPTFLAALAEVRAFSDNRTPAQVAITLKWVPFSGVLFNEIAANLIEKHHRGEVAATRILALGNLAAYDAIIGCFETKYVYWYIRPTQADPLITLATGLPNHPSYPSAHSCETGAWQTVLTEAFPSERRMLEETAQEASLSRIMGGLHYRFDGDAGLALGHRAGRLALRRGIR